MCVQTYYNTTYTGIKIYHARYRTIYIVLRSSWNIFGRNGYTITYSATDPAEPLFFC